MARPFDGNSDGSALCDIGAYEAVTPVLATATSTVTPTPTSTPTPRPTNTPMATSTPTITPTATQTVSPTLSPTPTATTVFDVRPYVVASANTVQVGERITVVVTLDNQSVGCVYPIHELTLSQLGDPIFRFDSPATVSEPVAASTIYTLTALAPGRVGLQASAYGERYCNDFWQWTYVNGSTGPLTVVEQRLTTPTPTLTATATPTPTPTPTTSPTPSATTVFDVRVTVQTATNTVQVGEHITVAVTIDNQSVGCSYPVFELTVSQFGDPIFRFDSPSTVRTPSNQTIYMLTAMAPGSTTLQASAYGERYCNDFWQWRYVNGATEPLTVTMPTPVQLYLPIIQKE